MTKTYFFKAGETVMRRDNGRKGIVEAEYCGGVPLARVRWECGEVSEVAYRNIIARLGDIAVGA